MTEMSAAEAAVVARFEAGEPAPESWGGGLREAIARAMHDAEPRGWLYIADQVLALPEVADLRAKADAADRVRELVEELTVVGKRVGPIQASALRYAADEICAALDGQP